MDNCIFAKHVFGGLIYRWHWIRWLSRQLMNLGLMNKLTSNCKNYILAKFLSNMTTRLGLGWGWDCWSPILSKMILLVWTWQKLMCLWAWSEMDGRWCVPWPDIDIIDVAGHEQVGLLPTHTHRIMDIWHYQSHPCICWATSSPFLAVLPWYWDCLSHGEGFLAILAPESWTCFA